MFCIYDILNRFYPLLNLSEYEKKKWVSHRNDLPIFIFVDRETQTCFGCDLQNYKLPLNINISSLDPNNIFSGR